MFNKILLASDGSDGAQKAIEAAVEVCRKFEAQLTVLHVFVPPALTAVTIGAGEPLLSVDPALVEQWAQNSADAVAERASAVLQAASVPFTFRREMGHAAEVIVRVAQQDGFDLIVLGSRGLSGVTEFLLGSVSNRVSHHAPCPVLLVH
jgi:nucleotide-binding universal stress UspA family protein